MMKGYKKEPVSFTRRMVIASVNGNKKNAIHCLTKVDVTQPRIQRKEYFDQSGTNLSFTAYVVKCFAETIKEFPEMNAFIKGRNLILLDDVNISVLIEREIEGVKVPEPLGIKGVQAKSVLDIHGEIRTAQSAKGDRMGELNNATWIRFIPGFLLKLFIKIADRNIKLAKKYGKLAVTAVGMYSPKATWFIPHGTATVLLTVGSLEKIRVSDSETKEELCITASFDHEIIDGAPASRFMARFDAILSSGVFVKELINI